jgi:hypothetical protein
MFLGILDPDLDPLVRGKDPDQDCSIIKKNSTKNLDSYRFCDFFFTFIVEK